MTTWRPRPKKTTWPTWEQWPQWQQPKQQPANVVTGFDGKKRSLDLPSSSATSSAPYEPGVQDLKEMLRQLSTGGRLTPEQLQLLEASPRSMLKEEQKALNQKRRQMNKERGLRQKIESTKAKFAAWEKAQSKLMEEERERYETELQRLEKDLRKATQEAEEDMEQERSVDTMDMSTYQRDLGAMENRALQAERIAWESQQAVLAMQSQLQQMVAYQQSLGMPQESTTPWTNASPGANRPTPAAESTSPQLPKNGVIKPGLKHNRPRVRKASDKKDAKDAIQVDSDEHGEEEGTPESAL